MRTSLALLFALASSGCVIAHHIAVSPSTLPIPADAEPGKRVDAKGCTMFVFGFLPVSGQSTNGMEPHSAYDLIEEAAEGQPVAGVTIEEWQRLWFPVGTSHCTRVNGRIMDVPKTGPRRKADDE